MISSSVLAVAQLVERWTVVGTLISIGHWFDSGRRDCFDQRPSVHSAQVRHTTVPYSYDLYRYIDQNLVQKSDSNAPCVRWGLHLTIAPQEVQRSRYSGDAWSALPPPRLQLIHNHTLKKCKKARYSEILYIWLPSSASCSRTSSGSLTKGKDERCIACGSLYPFL